MKKTFISLAVLVGITASSAALAETWNWSHTTRQGATTLGPLVVQSGSQPGPILASGIVRNGDNRVGARASVIIVKDIVRLAITFEDNQCYGDGRKTGLNMEGYMACGKTGELLKWTVNISPEKTK